MCVSPLDNSYVCVCLKSRGLSQPGSIKVTVSVVKILGLVTFCTFLRQALRRHKCISWTSVAAESFASLPSSGKKVFKVQTYRAIFSGTLIALESLPRSVLPPYSRKAVVSAPCQAPCSGGWGWLRGHVRAYMHVWIFSIERNLLLLEGSVAVKLENSTYWGFF